MESTSSLAVSTPPESKIGATVCGDVPRHSSRSFVGAASAAAGADRVEAWAWSTRRASEPHQLATSTTTRTRMIAPTARRSLREARSARGQRRCVLVGPVGEGGAISSLPRRSRRASAHPDRAHYGVAPAHSDRGYETRGHAHQPLRRAHRDHRENAEPAPLPPPNQQPDDSAPPGHSAPRPWVAPAPPAAQGTGRTTAVD